MEVVWLCMSLSFLFFILALNFFFPRRRFNLPPSPTLPFPLLGHLHLLNFPLHRTFQKFSSKLGPVFSLRFGNRLVVVVSSATAVEECFTTNDVVLANRVRFILGKYVGYNYTIMSLSSYGDHWRNLRRLGAVEVFSSHRLNAFLSIRRDEIRRLLRSLGESTRHGSAKIELRSKLTELTFNVVMRMVSGKRYFGEDGEEAKQFRGLIKELAQLASASNPGDFVTILRWIDYKDIRKKSIALSKKMDSSLQRLIDEHREKRGQNTVIDHLLTLQESQPDYYNDEIIKGFALVLLTAGTETSSVTLEWAMSVLLNHPKVVEKMVAELNEHLRSDQLIDEPDLSKLQYLNCVVLETLRLFPAAPLLLPHMASMDCKVGGYDVPSGTMLLVNAWAMQRDPEIWDDPTEFKPERFLKEEAASKLLPFGMGRRSCPGSGLALRVIGLTLGSLTQCFEWERIGEQKIDLTEGKGLTMPKATALEAICKPRISMVKFLA